VGGLAVALLTPASTALADSDSLVVEPHSMAYGNTYSEWAAEGAQMMFSILVADNPIIDDTGS
jgi:hypothetical protein